MDLTIADPLPAHDRRSDHNGLTAIPVIIVGYRNADDICACLEALAKADAEPRFNVYICENGGPAAYQKLIDALTTRPCLRSRPQTMSDPPPQAFLRVSAFDLISDHQHRRVLVGEARDNLGYAGGINAWLAPLLERPGWPGIWVLNPDTQPAADALRELVVYADRHRRGMVGSRIVAAAMTDVVHSRGLAWRRLRAATLSVESHRVAHLEPDPEQTDARLDSPCGASMYVTRACLEAIGLMDERFFLYFEDLDWGLRAKPQFGVGYAHRSIVVHKGGTTIGGAGHRARHSSLSVYLDYRNRIHFVRKHFPGWVAWTVLMSAADALRFAVRWPPTNIVPAIRGLLAGLSGEMGRPDHVLSRHRGPTPDVGGTPSAMARQNPTHRDRTLTQACVTPRR